MTTIRPHEELEADPKSRLRGCGKGNVGCNVGALIIGFLGPFYHRYNKEPQTSIGNF